MRGAADAARGGGGATAPEAEPAPVLVGPDAPPAGAAGPIGAEDADALLEALRRSLADLDGTDLDSTDLDGTDLDGTDLEGTDLEGTDLEGTDLDRTEPGRSPPATGGWPAPTTDPSIAWAAPPPAATPRPAEAPAAPAPARATAPPAATPAAGGRPRLVIERVQLVSAGLTTSVTVVLAHDGRTVQGTAEGTATTGSLHRSVAAATLRAVESVVGEGVRFDVEHVEVARTGTDRTALVVVTMVTERATQRLSGASVVREDVRQAVIRAVLAAVNRRVEPLIPGVEGAPA